MMHLLKGVPVLALIIVTAAAVTTVLAMTSENRTLDRVAQRMQQQERVSISENAQVQKQLDVLARNIDFPQLPEYAPAAWMDALQNVALSARVQSFNGRVLVQQSDTIALRASREILATPLEFRFTVAQAAQAGVFVEALSAAIGQYLLMENCSLRVSENTIDGFTFNCRVRKLSSRVTDS